MVINGTAGTGATGAPNPAQATKNGTLGKDDFLKLLVTQLQNQDPLNPTDNAQFVSQLAQFSSLEGITNLNTSMTGVSDGMTALQNSNAATLIGKNVKAEGSEFAYSSSPVTLGYDLTGAASKVTLSVFDSNGKLVNSYDGGAQSKGAHDVSWDGKDASGAPCKPGLYNFSVNAKGANGNAVSAGTYIYGRVSGVSMDSGKANLLVGGAPVTQNKLKEIY